MIKLIVSDVDGTLVADGTPDINPEYYTVIEQLVEKGIHVCIASGRQFESIRKLFLPIQDKLFYICEGGGVVRSFDQVLHLDPLPGAYPGLVRDVRKSDGFEMMLATPNESLIESGEDSELYHLMSEGYRYRIVNMENLDEAPWDQAVKLSLYHSTDAEGECARCRLIENWSGTFQILCAGIHWVDCVSMTSNKGNAVTFLRNYLGLSKEEILVFGDNMNDVAMFEAAGTSCTVANAREEVKQAADYVTDSYEQDGVLKELKKLL